MTLEELIAEQARRGWGCVHMVEVDVKFANGWTVSVQFGRGAYCTGRDLDGDLLAPAEPSVDAEVAAWKGEGEMIELGDDTVAGWQPIENVRAALDAAARDGRAGRALPVGCAAACGGAGDRARRAASSTTGGRASGQAEDRRRLMSTEVVRDVCMDCGRPWDGATLPASYTKAWCRRCEDYKRFHAQTFVPKADYDRLRGALKLIDVMLTPAEGDGIVRGDACKLSARLLARQVTGWRGPQDTAIPDEVRERVMEVVAEEFGACSNVTADRILAAALQGQEESR